MRDVRLRKPLERSLRSGHPWLFRDALEAFEVPAGTPVRVTDRNGRFLAVGLAEAGPIGVRVFSLRDEPVDATLFRARLARAFALRARCIPEHTDAYRLLHGEGDALPGFVCDRYGSAAVLKLDGEAAPAVSQTFLSALTPLLEQHGVSSLILRTSRKQADACEVVWGPAPPRELLVSEHGMRLWTNLYEGQKTGLFLDHRETRYRVRQRARGLTVLNLYGYTGGFSIAAGLGGAEHVTTVDQAKPALALAERSYRDNGLSEASHTCQAADALKFLETAAKSGKRYQLVIADPPTSRRARARWRTRRRPTRRCTPRRSACSSQTVCTWPPRALAISAARPSRRACAGARRTPSAWCRCSSRAARQRTIRACSRFRRATT